MNSDEGTSGGSSAGDKKRVPEPAGCLPEDTMLIYNLDSPYFDIVEILHTSTSKNTSHVPLPMPIRHPWMTEAVVAEDKVKNNESEVVNLTRVVNDKDSNKVITAGGTNTVGGDQVPPIKESSVPVSSSTTQSGDPVMVNEGERSSLKRGRGRPRKLVSSQSQLGDLPVAIRRREMPERSCKKHKAAETLPCRRNHDISGSGEEQKAAATIPYPLSPDISGSPGSGFLLHTITVRTKEDVLGKLLSFLRLKKQAVCILSANGTISNVTLLQSSSSGGTVTYQGCFEILSLSGSFLPSESGGQHSSTGGLSVLLAGPDGRVLGGSVSGLFTAASSVQIIVGTFSGGKISMKHQAVMKFMPLS